MSDNACMLVAHDLASSFHAYTDAVANLSYSTDSNVEYDTPRCREKPAQRD